MTSSTFDRIRTDCPCFRVLIAGKTGVGKTTLIKRTFNIGRLEGSNTVRGECDIEEEIRSSENELFVLHDSKGFEPSEVDNFNTVKAFIERRAQEPLIKNRLHAVWLCLQIPANRGRLLENGDEEFLRLPFGDIPVTIVFTKYDLLYAQIFYDNAKELASMASGDREKLIKQKATDYFQKNCIDVINKIEDRPKNLRTVWVSTAKDTQYFDTLAGLVKVTLEQLRDVQGSDPSTRIVSAAAQRVNADANITTCIEVGIQKYWRDLATGVHFSNQCLRDCINVIHGDIVAVWNFRDETNILQKDSFKEAVCGLVGDLADPHGRGPSADKSELTNQKNIKATLSTSVSICAPKNFFVKWFSEKYTRNPDVLRCLMGYIVDITIVLEILFWRKVAQQQSSVCQKDIDAALEFYQGSTPHFDIHRQIRHYVDTIKAKEHMNQGDNTHLEIESLINSNRRALPIDTIFSQSQKENTSDQAVRSPESPEPGSSSPPKSPENSKQQPAVQSETAVPTTSGKKKKFTDRFKIFRKTH